MKVSIAIDTPGLQTKGNTELVERDAPTSGAPTDSHGNQNKQAHCR